PIQERMHLQLAPVGGEVAVLARGEVALVPEEQHLALEQRRHELGDLLGRRVGEVDAGDLRADVGVHGADPDVRVPGRRVVGVRTGEAQAFGPELDLMFTDGDLHDSSPDQLYTNDYTPTVHTRIRCGYGTANDDRRRRGLQHARDRAPPGPPAPRSARADRGCRCATSPRPPASTSASSTGTSAARRTCCPRSSTTACGTAPRRSTDWTTPGAPCAPCSSAPPPAPTTAA